MQQQDVAAKEMTVNNMKAAMCFNMAVDYEKKPSWQQNFMFPTRLWPYLGWTALIPCDIF